MYEMQRMGTDSPKTRENMGFFEMRHKLFVWVIVYKRVQFF